MATFNDIINQTAELEAILEESGGELTPELEEAFDRLSQDMTKKVDGYGFLMRKLKANIDASKEIIKQMQAAVKAKENNLKNLKEHLAYNMQFYGMDRLAGDTCTLSLRNSTSLETDDAVLLSPYQDIIQSAQNELPSWIKLKAEVGKTELKAAFKEGDENMPAGMNYKNSKSLQIR